MRFCKLRIAFSATCLIACVLLIALWVRSYWWTDFLYGPVSEVRFFESNSYCGRLALSLTSDPVHLQHWKVYSHQSGPLDGMFAPWKWELGKSKFSDSWVAAFPHWFSVALFGVLSAAPWLRLTRRLSLRTLLIATTPVAVMLGLAAYATRK